LADRGFLFGSQLYLSAFFGHKQAAMRLLDLKKAAGMSETEFPVQHQLLPIEDDPVKTWEWIDREALSALRSGDIDHLRNIGLALLLTKHRALGILVGEPADHECPYDDDCLESDARHHLRVSGSCDRELRAFLRLNALPILRPLSNPPGSSWSWRPAYL
jgi:hypothetical protein